MLLMRGHRVSDVLADTHGLPIEMLAEKELGPPPAVVREFGVAEFNEGVTMFSNTQKSGVVLWVD